MVKNIPAPCCGTYDIFISARSEKGRIWYTAKCPYCGLAAADESDTKQEAIYEYEQMCIDTWRRNRNGLLDWMKSLPKDTEDRARRIQIEDDVRRILGI